MVVFAMVTFTGAVAETLEASSESPEKVAVMVCWPGRRPVVEYVATPLAFGVTVPKSAPASVKVTEPVGFPASALPELPVTVAVRFNAWPAISALLDAVSVVVVAWRMVSDSGWEFAAAWFVSPE
jgi:hypothetical protein